MIRILPIYTLFRNVQLLDNAKEETAPAKLSNVDGAGYKDYTNNVG